MTVTCPLGAMRRNAFGAKPAPEVAAAAAWANRDVMGSVNPMTSAPVAAAEPLRKSRRVLKVLVLMAVSVPQAPSVAAASLMAARIRL